MGLSIGVLALLAIAASCREPTQITLRITTREKCSDLTGVQIVVGPTAEVTQSRFTQRYSAALTRACTPSGTGNLIGTLVVTPGASSGTVVVSAGVNLVSGPSGMVVPGPDPAACADPANAKQCIVARRSFSFIDHTSLTLPIDLDPLCVGKLCDPASTCFKGACVDATVGCKDGTCGLPQETGDGSGSDASSSDGSYDGDGANLGDAMVDMDSGQTSSDAGDSGSMILDAGGKPPLCYKSAPMVACAANVYGVGDAGMQCDGTPNPMVTCCSCTCPSNAAVVSCDLVLFASSCAPTGCP
jgi:hypothetical protein